MARDRPRPRKRTQGRRVSRGRSMLRIGWRDAIPVVQTQLFWTLKRHCVKTIVFIVPELGQYLHKYL